MENNNNAKNIKVIEGIGDMLKRMGSDPEVFLSMALHQVARAYMPFIPLTDGGRARGRLVGLLAQKNIKLKDELVHNKTYVKGEFNSKEFAAGVREGRSVSFQKTRFKFLLLYASNRDSLKLEKLRDRKEMGADIVKKVMEAFK